MTLSHRRRTVALSRGREAPADYTDRRSGLRLRSRYCSPGARLLHVVVDLIVRAAGTRAEAAARIGRQTPPRSRRPSSTFAVAGAHRVTIIDLDGFAARRRNSPQAWRAAAGAVWLIGTGHLHPGSDVDFGALVERVPYSFGRRGFDRPSAGARRRSARSTSGSNCADPLLLSRLPTTASWSTDSAPARATEAERLQALSGLSAVSGHGAGVRRSHDCGDGPMTITGHSSRERCCWSPTTWLRSSRSTTRGSQPTSPTASIRQWSSVASTRWRGGYTYPHQLSPDHPAAASRRHRTITGLS